MANKRMFSKDVTNSEEFLEMPLSAQSLYFHLGMNADDDGFIDPRGTMRFVRIDGDEIKILIAKGFVIPFNDDKVIVITHWKVNNSIRADRKKETRHKEHLRQLGIDENGEYKPKELLRQPNDNQTTTKRPHRLDKVRLGKDSIDRREIKNFTSPPVYEEFDESEQTYKTKQKIYKQKGLKYKPSKKTLKSQRSFTVMKLLDFFKEQAYDLQGVEYFNHPKDKNSRMIGQASTFFTRCNDNEKKAKEVIKWFLDEYGEWCLYEPEQCFTPKTVTRFKNKDKTKSKVYNI